MKISFHLARVKARNGTGACFKTFLCQSFPCLVAYIENKDRFHIYTIHYQTVFVTYYIHNTGVWKRKKTDDDEEEEEEKEDKPKIEWFFELFSASCGTTDL